MFATVGNLKCYNQTLNFQFAIVMKLNPTILTNDKQSYIEQVTRAAKFADEIDIDVIDWEHSPGKTLTAGQSLEVDVQIPLNFDLMLDYPSESVNVLIKDHRVPKIIINIRSKENLVPIFEEIKTSGKQVAVSFSMAEEYEQIKQYFSLVDEICIFAIKPGAQGNPFRPEILNFADRLRQDGFDGIIGLDGGVNQENLPLILEHPFDIVVSGSAIAKSQNPEATYFELLGIIKQHTANKND